MDGWESGRVATRMGDGTDVDCDCSGFGDKKSLKTNEIVRPVLVTQKLWILSKNNATKTQKESSRHWRVL